MEINKKMRKLIGIIASDKMQKTRVVVVTRLKKHPKYLKYLRTSKRYKAHDEKNEYKMGEHVVIRETIPRSKDKHWEIIGLVKNAKSKTQNDPFDKTQGHPERHQTDDN